MVCPSFTISFIHRMACTHWMTCAIPTFMNGAPFHIAFIHQKFALEIIFNSSFSESHFLFEWQFLLFFLMTISPFFVYNCQEMETGALNCLPPLLTNDLRMSLTHTISSWQNCIKKRMENNVFWVIFFFKTAQVRRIFVWYL